MKITVIICVALQVNIFISVKTVNNSCPRAQLCKGGIQIMKRKTCLPTGAIDI